MAFPTNPTDGQLYNENGITYLYVSPPGAWTRAGGVPITIDEADPVFTNSPAVTYTEAPIDGTPYSRQDGGWVAAGGGGATVINDLTDVDTTGVVGGDVLKWNGAAWTPTTDDDTDSLAALTDTTLTSPANGEVLQYNGAAWVNATAPAGYTNADVDTHLNTSTATTDQVLSWDGADYAWVAAGGGGATAGNPLAFNSGSSGQELTNPTVLFEFDNNLTNTGSNTTDTLTFVGTPSYATGYNGSANTAVTVSGSTYANFINTPVVGPNDSNWFVGVWFKGTGVFSTNDCVFGTGFSGGNLLFCMAVVNDTTTPSLAIADYRAGWTRQVASTQPTWTDWNHYALQRNGDNIYLFLNGQLVATSTGNNAQTFPDSWVMGRYTSALAGEYDKWEMYNTSVVTDVNAGFAPQAVVKVAEIEATGTDTDSVLTFKQYESGVLTSYNLADLAGGASVWEDQTTYYRAAQHIVVGSATQTPDYLNSSFPGITINGSTGASVNFLAGGGSLQGRIFGQNAGLKIRPATNGTVELTNPNGQEILTVNYVTDKVTIGAKGSTGFTLPNTDGTANQVLQTDGAGTVSWATAGGGGGLTTTATSPVATTATLENLNSNVSMNTKGLASGFFVGPDTADNTSFATSYRLFGGAQVSLPYYGGLAAYTTAQTIVAGRNACGLSINGGSAGLNSGTTSFVVHDNLTTPKFSVNYNNGATDVTGDLTVGGSVVKLTNLPTSDPVVAGQLWNDAGTLKISAG